MNYQGAPAKGAEKCPSCGGRLLCRNTVQELRRKITYRYRKCRDCGQGVKTRETQETLLDFGRKCPAPLRARVS